MIKYFDEFYKLFKNIYNFLYLNDNKYYSFSEYFDNLISNISNIENECAILLKEFHFKNIIFKGISCNNFHLNVNEDLYSNVLQCLNLKNILNKKCDESKSLNLHLYLNGEKLYNIESLKKIEYINFDKKMLYLREDVNIIGDLFEYLKRNNYIIVHCVNNISDNNFHKNIRITINEDNMFYFINNFITYCNNLQNIYYNIEIFDKEKYFIVSNFIDSLIEKYPDKNFINVVYLLGEHIGVDNTNKIYMRVEDENIYDNFIDYYIKYNVLTKKCIDCPEGMFCMTKLRKFCIKDDNIT